ncbi:MAG: alpha/beta fold hydrolase [Thermodesulfobacteriota bacterium]
MGNVSICTYPFAEEYPFEAHAADIHGLRCHYVDEGDGLVVLMLHGNPTWSFFYRKLIQELSPFFRTVAPDHIGCGLSERPEPGTYPFTLERRIEDMERFIETVGLKRPLAIVAHDWGGAIATALSLRHPQWVSALILMNTAAFFPPKHKGLPLRLRIVRHHPKLAKLLILKWNAFVLSALFLAPSKPLSIPILNGYTAPYRKLRNREAVYRFVMDIPTHPDDSSWATLRWLDDRIAALARIPVLLVWGLQDAVFDQDYLLEWKRRLPHAESVVFPDAGHYLLEDEPEKAATAIRNFLKRLTEPEQGEQML